MHLVTGKILNSIMQILLFALIPFIWWCVTARGKINFFQWIGIKRASFQKENRAVLWTAGTTIIFLAVSAFILYTVRNIETAASEFEGLGMQALPAILVYGRYKGHPGCMDWRAREQQILGVWIGEHESSKFWLNVLNDLKSRGVLVFCVDGLKGFVEAIRAVYPHSQVQRCIVHQIRSSTRFVSYKDIKPLMADLKKVYTAVTEDEALDHLMTFKEKWGKQYPSCVKNLYSQPKPLDGRGIFPSGEANFRRNNCVYCKKIQRCLTGKVPARR